MQYNTGNSELNANSLSTWTGLSSPLTTNSWEQSGLVAQSSQVSSGNVELVSSTSISTSPVPNFFVDRRPDLVMQEVRIEQIVGGIATITWKVENTIEVLQIGIGARRGAPIEQPWADRLYLSTDRFVSSDDAILLAEDGRNYFRNEPILPAGGIYTRTEGVQLNYEQALRTGRFFLLVSTNPLVEDLPRPREVDDFDPGIDVVQIGANNTLAFDLRNYIPDTFIFDNPNGNILNFQPNGCGEPDTASLNSEVELHSGAVIETHSLVSYQSQGIDRGITLRYNSLYADPRHIIHFSASNVADQPGEQLLIARLAIERGGFTRQISGNAAGQYGLSGGEHFWAIPDSNASRRVQAALQFDLRDQSSGIYQYRLQRGIQTLNRNAPQFQNLTQNDLGTFVHVIPSQLIPATDKAAKINPYPVMDAIVFRLTWLSRSRTSSRNASSVS